MKAVVLLGVLAWSAAAAAADAPYQRLSPAHYQSFVGNWSPDAKPLCAVLRSQADWDKVMHPAPVMGGNRAFSPPPTIWDKQAVVLVARVIPGGAGEAFQIDHVTSGPQGLELDFRLTPPPPAAYQVKAYLAIAVDKAQVGQVRIRQNNDLICRLRPSAGDWLSPAAPAKP